MMKKALGFGLEASEELLTRLPGICGGISKFATGVLCVRESGELMDRNPC
jgi:hypothetical protein